MERLTLRSSETSHENGVCCTHFKSQECLEVGGNCAYGCKWEEAAWEKLASYEDSMLPPEGCKAAAEANTILETCGLSLDHIIDLIKADKAGMNITLPCKPGDKLFVLTTDSLDGIDGLYAKVVAPCVYDDWGGAHWEFTEEDFGTKVFLNQEDAEKARRKNELWSKGMSFCSER